MSLRTSSKRLLNTYTTSLGRLFQNAWQLFPINIMSEQVCLTSEEHRGKKTKPPSSWLGGSGSAKHTHTCLPLNTWAASLTSLEKWARSCQGLQEHCALASSCKQPFQLPFPTPSPFLEKDAKQECACRAGDLQWLRATKHHCVTQTLKKHTHRCFWRGNQQHSDSCPQA